MKTPHLLIALLLSLAPARGNPIDDLLARHAPPGAVEEAAPHVLVRRLYLDLAGELPPPEVVDDALAAPVDVDALTDRLLASPEFDRHWGRVLRTWLTSGIPAYQPLASRSLARWLAERLAAHVPVSAIAGELVSARGTALDHPAVSYLLMLRDSREDMAGHVARTLLGARIQCAQCHDHPFAAWKQDDFRAFADVFAQMRTVQWPVSIVERAIAGSPITPDQYLHAMPAYVRSKTAGTDERIRALVASYAAVRAEGQPTPDTATMSRYFEKLAIPRELRRELTPGTLALVLDTGDAHDTHPRFLDGTPVTDGPRRAAFARWIAADPQRRWARCLANRAWKQLMGRGLVEPVDELDRPDDARFADVLDAVAARWVADGAELRGLVRAIVSSRAYRRACRGEAPADARFAFQHALARPLLPEVLARCVLQCAGDTDPDRAATLTDRLARTLRTTSGVPAESLSPSLSDALFLMNGPLNELFAGAPTVTFRRALCRDATGAERAAFAAAAPADALFALCTSAEFQEVQ